MTVEGIVCETPEGQQLRVREVGCCIAAPYTLTSGDTLHCELVLIQTRNAQSLTGLHSEDAEAAAVHFREF